MLIKKTTLGVAAVALSTMMVTNAMAAKEGAYVGGQVGYGHFGEFRDYGKDNTSGGVAGRVFGGYQFNSYLAAELGWTKFSNLSEQGISLKTNAVDIVGKAILPVADGFNLYAKAGAAYVMSDVDVKGFGSGTEKKWFPTAGVGASYDITPNVAADVSYTRIQKTGNNSLFQSSDFVGVGLTYTFG